MKFSPRDLNSDLCPPHPISTYYCRVTIAPKCVVVKNEKKKCISWMHIIVYIFWKLYILNTLNWVKYLKNVYVNMYSHWKFVYFKCTELCTLFETLCILNIQNWVHYLKMCALNVQKYIHCLKKMYMLKVHNYIYYLKNVYVK